MTSTPTEYEIAVDYGRHVKGVLPDGTVTGVLAHDGNYWESYVDTGSWGNKHPQWVREYEETPIGQALKKFVKGEELWIQNTVYKGTYYEMAPMESAGLTGWRYEYERKKLFQRKVLGGDITLPAPAIFNQYGDCYIEEGYEEEVRDLYWDFIDENYTHKHSHQKVTKSKGEAN